MAPKKYDVVMYRGSAMDRYTKRALKLAEKKAGFKFGITQGSYNAGGVAASGGTHDGGGALDISTNNLSKKKKAVMLKSLKRAGFAAWLRTPAQGFGEHVHAIQHGNKKASAGAKAQRGSYDRGRDGLRSDRKDPNPWRTKLPRKYSWKTGKTVTR